VIFSDTDYLLLDRKSGKEDVLSEGISNQLKVYALKMLLKKGLTSLNGIRMEAYEIFLNTMNTHGGNIAQADIESIIAKIKKDVDYQKQFLINQNPIQNIPLDFFAFRKTSSERKCESCTFRAVCKKLR
jgi:hypothetical protein